ncbi:MAG: hypothetical protein HY520_03665 [Candidatus Aenigmarchaeota archaeon]|nr:hypothetical protein [Candidatus Aenigmarchaeota archaeon]
MASRSRKGQTLVFEQVLLFSFSVVVFIVAFTIFSITQDITLEANADNQLDAVTELVAESVLAFGQHPGNGTVVIPVPRVAGDAVYEVELDQAGLTVTNLKDTAITKTHGLYDLKSAYALGGKATSAGGKLIVKKDVNPTSSSPRLTLVS